MMPKDEFNEICENTRTVAKIMRWLLLGGVALVIGLAAFSGKAQGETYILRDQQGNHVMLQQTPCKMPWLSKWFEASMVFQEKPYAACWKLMGDGNTVMVLDSTGDLTALPLQAFRKAVQS